MDIWKSCVSVALVGTDRQTPALPEEKSALADIVRQMDWTLPESALLGAAGAIALHQSVGWRPETTNFPAISPCDPEDLPCCSQRSERHLEKALDKHPEVLPELLGLMAASGQRVPAQRLPKVLNFGKRKKDYRLQIIAVLGNRGRWLAAQNPQWTYATQELSELSKAQQDSPTSDPRPSTSETSKETTAQWIGKELQQSQRWNIELSRLALKRFFEAAKDKPNHIELSRISIPLSVALHPGLAPEFSQRVKTFSEEGSHSTLQTFLNRAASIVTLRWDIYQAFVPSG